MSFRGRGNASGANRGGFGGGRGGEIIANFQDAKDQKELTKFFLSQAAEVSSSHSAPQPRFWVISSSITQYWNHVADI